MKDLLARPYARCLYALFFLLAAWHCPPFDHVTVLAEGTSVLKGRVLDVAGESVEGAMVFVYNNPEVKREADFISAPTDSEGRFRMVVPPGEYWVVARLKKSEEFGPLMPGDKHSGDPEEIELATDSEEDMEFVVADLRDAIKMKKDAREGTVRITGRIIDEKGAPVKRAYVIANRKEEVSGIPDYLSAWVDKDGNYTLYVPEGTYFIGSADTFPPGKNYNIIGEIAIETDISGMDVLMNIRNNRLE
jgi:hypothetical protein